jgi:thiamine kinase
MLWGELESLAARHVPGRGKPDINRVSSGLLNETYRVRRDGNTYALRVAGLNAYELGVDRAWEARVLERAIRADLAPMLEYCDPERGILISRWLDGRSWSPAEVRAPVNIAKMAEFLRRIHGLPSPKPAREMNPAKWIELYAGAVRGGSGDRGAKQAASAAADLQAMATARLQALAELPVADAVLCHSDLHTLNLIDRGRSLALLDWEYAHASDPLWDVAGWSANNDFDEDGGLELLASYAGRPPTRDECSRLEVLRWLYDYVCLLWGELYLNLYRDTEPTAAVPIEVAPAPQGVAPQGVAPEPARHDTVTGGSALEDICARALQLAARLRRAG